MAPHNRSALVRVTSVDVDPSRLGDYSVRYTYGFTSCFLPLLIIPNIGDLWG